MGGPQGGGAPGCAPRNAPAPVIRKLWKEFQGRLAERIGPMRRISLNVLLTVARRGAESTALGFAPDAKQLNGCLFESELPGGSGIQ